MDASKPKTPIWQLVVRVITFVLSIIIIGLSASLIHGKYFNEIGFAIVCSLFTWVIVIYNVLPALISSLQPLHHVFAILGLDAFMVIFWFSSMAANAALRGSFKYNVHVNGCYDDGSAVNSATCIVSRGAVATSVGLGEMSAIAGLSALNFLLFLATLIFGLVGYFRNRRGGSAHDPSLPVQMMPQSNQQEQEKQSQVAYNQLPAQQPYQQPFQQPVQQQYQQPYYQPDQQQQQYQQPYQQPHELPHGSQQA